MAIIQQLTKKISGVITSIYPLTITKAVLNEQNKSVDDLLLEKVDANLPITAATATKITYDSKGLVVSGTNLTASDIPTIQQTQVQNLVSDLASKFPTANVKNAYDNGIGNVYSANYVNGNFAPRTFADNLYFNRSGATTANLLPTKPTVSAANYLTLIGATNTTINWAGTQKYVITRATESVVTFDKNSSFNVTIPVAFSRNATVEFGARILIGGVAVSSNQTFGQVSYNGSTNYADVYDATFNVLFDALTVPTTYPIGTNVVIEIFQRQLTTPALTTRIYCGVNQAGSNRFAYTLYNFTSTSINASQIADGAVTLPKLASDVVAEINSKRDNLNVVSDLVSATQTVSVASNTIYKFSTLTSLTISALATFDDDSVIWFSSGATATTFSYPAGIFGTGDINLVPPTVNANYVIVFSNGKAMMCQV